MISPYLSAASNSAGCTRQGWQQNYHRISTHSSRTCNVIDRRLLTVGFIFAEDDRAWCFEAHDQLTTNEEGWVQIIGTTVTFPRQAPHLLWWHVAGNSFEAYHGLFRNVISTLNANGACPRWKQHRTVASGPSVEKNTTYLSYLVLYLFYCPRLGKRAPLLLHRLIFYV